MHNKNYSHIYDAFKKLDTFVVKKDYKGIDVYDGLNSRLLNATPLIKNRWVRLAWIQFFKHCPINLRTVFGVPPGFNAKAGALFLLGNSNMYEATRLTHHERACHQLFSQLNCERIQRKSGNAWGYNFPWQARAFYVPIGTPNTVTSVYVGQALLKYARLFHHEQAYQHAQDIGDFLLKEMVLWENASQACFGYIPGEKAEVHNVNLMVAAYLCEINQRQFNPRIQKLIHKAVRFSLQDKKKDGYWPYGKRSHHRWMDNFHSAFNIESLLKIRHFLPSSEYDLAIKNSLEHFMKTFFLKDSTPKYYVHKVYPIDIHTLAVDIIVLLQCLELGNNLFHRLHLKKYETLAEKLIIYGLKNFQDKSGYFYYQKNKFFTNKIPYLRWNQAWMHYALSCMIRYLENKKARFAVDNRDIGAYHLQLKEKTHAKFATH